MKKYCAMLVMAVVLILQGCTWDLMGPCHRATLLRKDAEHVSGLKKAELLGKADGLQAECERNNQKVYDSQKPGR
jgi:hypothetical protein